MQKLLLMRPPELSALIKTIQQLLHAVQWARDESKFDVRKRPDLKAVVRDHGHLPTAHGRPVL
jgi:hypothetical protein